MADNIYIKLAKIQNELKSPKDQKAKQYRYRNIEDINEAVKPLALKNGCAIRFTDDFVWKNDILICESICILEDGEDSRIKASGLSIVNTKPQFMSIEQSCGAASSYARKYAACGLFAIDSSELDPDNVNKDKEPKNQAEKPKKKADPLHEAKIALWNTVKEYAAMAGIDAELFYTDVMREVGNDPTPDRVLFQRNVLLTELRAENDKPVE